MRHGFRKGLALLLACTLSLALFCAWPGAAGADETGDVSGSTAATTTFKVNATGSGSGYIRLFAAKGKAYVADYDFYGNFSGYKEEDDFGFFRVQVTGDKYSQAYDWVPSATMNTASSQTASVVSQQSLLIVFPKSGSYSVTVTPLMKEQINGVYWTQNRMQYWTQNATWIVNKAVNCQCYGAGGGGTQPAYGQVTVYCYDNTGAYIRSYTETVQASKTIYPQAITGYTAMNTAGQYVTYSNGKCTPENVAFYYNKAAASGTVTVYCYDTNGAYIRSYTETITAGKTIYPQAISGYNTTSGGAYIAFSNGVCNPATVTFKYQKAQTSATVTVYCYDTNGSYIRSYTETVNTSKTIYPQAISGYNIASAGQYVSFSNGAANPSTVTFKYQKVQNPATVTVNCYDTNGNYIRSYSETLTDSKTIYPQGISGYKTVSGGQYITYSNGTANPASVTFQYEQYATSATVNVTCYDMNGNYLNAYTETVTESRTISPQAIDGYTIASGGQYVTFANGAANPSNITFKYQKIQNPATLNIDCYDSNGNYIRSYTETITASKTVYPQAISGYNIASGGQAVTYSDGTCSPSLVTFTYSKIPTPATLTIRCIDNNGNVIRTTTESITANRSVNPPQISGYTAMSGAQTVTFTDGACEPSQIDFQYQIGSAVEPGTNPRASYPVSWDTQFKPGTSKNNADRLEKLPYLYDDNASTSFFWIYWSSEKEDNIPEITAYFDSATISSIGIRNGNTRGDSSYRKYGRATGFTVKLYDNSGNEFVYEMDIPDSYTSEYREFGLGTTYTDIARVDLWLKGYKPGDDSSVKHYIHIGDLIFYK